MLANSYNSEMGFIEPEMAIPCLLVMSRNLVSNCVVDYEHYNRFL